MFVNPLRRHTKLTAFHINVMIKYTGSSLLHMYDTGLGRMVTLIPQANIQYICSMYDNPFLVSIFGEQQAQFFVGCTVNNRMPARCHPIRFARNAKRTN